MHLLGYVAQFQKIQHNVYGMFTRLNAGLHSAVSSASDSRARGHGFDTRSDHILSFLLPLIQEGSCQLLAKVCAQSTGLPLGRSKPAEEKCG